MSEQAKTVIDETFKRLVKTYVPQPVVLDHAKGSYVWDTDGKKYLDFAAGIAVVSLGHASPAVLKTINDQAATLMMCQASYATAPKLKAAQLLTDNSIADLVYFCNSGTEAIEAAMKCVRKWAYTEKGPECNEIIAFRNSFHGRTYGAASITEKRMSQPYFEPYIPAIHFAEFNNFASVEKVTRDARPIVDDLKVFAQKIADDPRQLGVKGALDKRPSGVGFNFNKSSLRQRAVEEDAVWIED